MEEDGSCSGVFNEMDLMANARDIKSLKDKLANELIEYSKEQKFPVGAKKYLNFYGKIF